MSVILTIQWHLQALQAAKQQMTMVVPPSLSVTKSEPISKMTSMPVTSILGFTITPGISNKTKGGSIQDPGSQAFEQLAEVGKIWKGILSFIIVIISLLSFYIPIAYSDSWYFR